MTPEPNVIQQNAVLNALSQHIVVTQDYRTDYILRKVILVTFYLSAASMFKTFSY